MISAVTDRTDSSHVFVGFPTGPSIHLQGSLAINRGYEYKGIDIPKYRQNSAYRRHSISRHVRIVAPIQNKANFFLAKKN